MYDITWLLRGAQSAAFYYVSCSPYTRRRNRRRRAREIEEDRLAQHAIEEQNPHLYRQPSPYRRNKFWEEDIRMGPDRSDRRKGRAGRSAKRQQPGKREEMTASQPELEHVASDSLVDDEKTDLKDRSTSAPPTKPDPVSSAADHRASAAHMAELAMDDIKNFVRNAAESGKQKWNAMRQQRPDEELWGLPSANQSSVHQASYTYSSKASSLRPSANGDSSFAKFPRLGRTETLDSYSTDSFQTVARIPPVNDMHPPIVSHPVLSKNANRWMKQPPPPSSVMGGFEHSSHNNSARNSRSGSIADGNASSSNLAADLAAKRGGDAALQRKLSARIIRDKGRSNETDATSLLAVPEPAHLRPRTPASPRLNKARSHHSVSDHDRDTTDATVDEPRTPDSAVDMTTTAAAATSIAERDFAIATGPISSKPTRHTIHRAVSSTDRPISPEAKTKAKAKARTSKKSKSSRKSNVVPRPLRLRGGKDVLDTPTAQPPMSPDSVAAWRFHYPYPLDTATPPHREHAGRRLGSSRSDDGDDEEDDDEDDDDDDANDDESDDVEADDQDRARTRDRRVSAAF